MTGRSEGLLIPWRSVLSEVSGTAMSVTHSHRERCGKGRGKQGSMRRERVGDLYVYIKKIRQKGIGLCIETLCIDFLNEIIYIIYIYIMYIMCFSRVPTSSATAICSI